MCARQILTVCCLICKQRCQFLVLLFLRQQFDGKVGPRHHCSVFHLLISQNLSLCLKETAKTKHTKQKFGNGFYLKLKLKNVKGNRLNFLY